jgi:ABC-type multidrug transport system fused ATPase/permease subunit
VVNACALEADFEILPAKDETEIGEKGINLSGGQKQRVSLARAVYQDSDIYLLDDPLSSVDAHVAQHLFQQVIGPNGLLQNKTRLLATHHISFLKEVNAIIVMKNGQIIGHGNYKELYSKGLLSEEIYGTNEENIDQSLAQKSNVKLESQISVQSQNEKFGDESCGQLIEEEEQEIGNIQFNIYINYIKRCGLLMFSLTLFANLSFNFCETGANFWLNLWTSQNATELNDSSNRNYHLIVYVIAILFESFFIALGVIAIFNGALKAATQYHKDMILCVLRSPLTFFDKTPNGRILNRFSSDMYKIDDGIPMNFMFYMQTVCWFPFVYIVIFYTNLYLGIAMITIAILYYILYVSQ